MMDKPVGCRTCPLYDDGKGYVPGLYPEGASVLLLGQNPGVDEEREARPLVGKTGQFIDTRLLPLAGLDPHGVARDNVIRCRWRDKGKKTNDLPPNTVLQEAMAHCAQYDMPMPETVVAMGRAALWKMHGAPAKVHEWRGHVLSP